MRGLSACVLFGLAGPLFALPFPAYALTPDSIPDDLLFLLAAALLTPTVLLLPAVLWLRRQWRQSLEEIQRLDSDRARSDEILAVAPDGFYCWTLDADGAIAAEQCSRRMAVLLGLYKGTDATYAEILDSLGAGAAGVLDVAVQALHGQGVGFEFELALRDGHRRLLAIGGRASDEEGRPLADVLWMRDVTEGAAAVENLSYQRHGLEAERDRLRALLDALPLPVWLRDGDLALTYCNRAYARAVDVPSPVEAVEAGTELAAGGTVREARAMAARARASGLPRSEAFHLVIGGERRLVELTETPFMVDGREGLLTVGTAIDRTRQEEAQREVGRHVSAHAEVLENLGTAIAIFATDTRLTFFNTAFSRLWHLDPGWLSTEPTYGNILDQLRENRRLPEVADYRAYKDDELRRFTSLLEAKEDLLHLPDERTLRRFVSAHPFGGLLFTYEDVTDAIALETSHKTSLAVHRETLDQLYEGVAVFSSDGRLRLSNPAYARIWNLSAGELDGEPHFSELVERHGAFFRQSVDWAGMRDNLLALFSERAARHGRIERQDGAILEYGSVPLPDGAMLFLWLDVTDTARVERALRERNDALAAADRLKSEFIANVSAEMRTPLDSILGFSELLNQDYFGDLSPRQAELVRGISESGEHLRQVLSDIVDLATIEAGQMTLSLNAIDVHGMLTGVLRLTRERVREKQLQLKFDCPLDIGWMVADERRIRQVLFNLLSNAVKFTPSHGAVTLEAQRIQGEAEDEIEFTVADSGPGIEAKDQARMFGTFVRGNGGESSHPGAGLGLALVKSFVALHSGRIEVASTPGSGTAFRVLIPAGRAEPI